MSDTKTIVDNHFTAFGNAVEEEQFQCTHASTMVFDRLTAPTSVLQSADRQISVH